MPRIGDFIWGGEIARAIWEYERNGGGADGWEAAESALAERFPDADPRSVRALIADAQEVNAERRRYANAGPNYTIPADAVPDYRRAERDAGLPPGTEPGDRGPAKWYTEGIIEVYDARYGDTVIQRFSVTVPGEGPMTKQQLLDVLEDQGEYWVGIFGGYESVEGRLEELSFKAKLIGTWIGY